MHRENGNHRMADMGHFSEIDISNTTGFSDEQMKFTFKACLPGKSYCWEATGAFELLDV